MIESFLFEHGIKHQLTSSDISFNNRRKQQKTIKRRSTKFYLATGCTPFKGFNHIRKVTRVIRLTFFQVEMFGYARRYLDYDNFNVGTIDRQVNTNSKISMYSNNKTLYQLRRR